GRPMPPTTDAVDPMAPVKAPTASVATPLPPLPSVPPPSAPQFSVADRVSGRRPSPPVAAPTQVEAPPAVAQPVASNRRVAQFITADVAQSQLTVAADGKLPELQLNADNAGPRKRKVLVGGNSWATVVLISLSLLAAVAMIMIDTGAAPTSNSTDTDSRIRIEKRYFGDDGTELRPYQILLRRAQQAHDRGDRKAERQYYLQVLGMLRDENLHPLGRNLTGMEKKATDKTLPSDEDLEDLISKVLGER
ncbi:MAG: hypothetical protein K8T91_13200, partial [Planctomycetes bacterium]|nr:hypothetical protein [Planctomycetota bacterium]